MFAYSQARTYFCSIYLYIVYETNINQEAVGCMSMFDLSFFEGLFVVCYGDRLPYCIFQFQLYFIFYR